MCAVVTHIAPHTLDRCGSAPGDRSRRWIGRDQLEQRVPRPLDVAAGGPTALAGERDVELRCVADPDGVAGLVDAPAGWQSASAGDGLGEDRRGAQPLALEIGE